MNVSGRAIALNQVIAFLAMVKAIRHYCLKEIMQLGNTITAHDERKEWSRTAIAKQDMLDMATVSEDNCCALGKWLYGEAPRKPQGFTRLPHCCGLI
jgi:hypothetical protein